MRQEQIAVRRMETKRIHKAKTLAENMNMTKTKAMAQIKAAQFGATEGKERMRNISRKTRPIAKVAAKKQKAKYDERAEAFMSLKRNTDKAKSEMIGKNEKRAKVEARRRKLESDEAEAILAEGGNPYEVFRKRRLDTDAVSTHML